MGAKPCDASDALLERLHRLTPLLLHGYTELADRPSNALWDLAIAAQASQAADKEERLHTSKRRRVRE